MRKLSYLWTLLLALMVGVSFASCENDDDGGGGNGNAPAALLGSWNLYGDIITFQADGKMVWAYSDGDTETYSYSYNGGNNTIVMSAYGETETWKVVTLTSNKLVVEDEDGYTMTLTKGGATGGDGDGDGLDEVVGIPGPAYDTSAPISLPDYLPYEEVSGRYEVAESGTGYGSIELTARGQYIVTPENSPFRNLGAVEKAGKKSASPFKRTAQKRDLTDGGLLAGNFIQIGENEYELEGFGTLTVRERDNEGNITRFTLYDYNSGASIALSVYKTEGMPLEGNTKNLCRTWTIVEERAEAWKNDILYLDAIHNLESGSKQVYVRPRAWNDDAEICDDYFEFEDYNVQVVFSHTGSYVEFYSDGDLPQISRWSWIDMDHGKLSWWDAYESGDMTFKFYGNMAMVTNEYVETLNGNVYTSRATLILRAVD